MKVGLISDIHSNKHALDAVLDDMPEVDEVVCCGDIVGYNAYPAECLETVREIADVVVQGNHDRQLQQPERYKSNNMAYEGLLHTRQELTEEEIEWLSNLPPSTQYGSYRIVHSHPSNTGAYVYPRDFPRMRTELDDNEVGMVLGHTHIQHEATVDGCLIVNPGSVGQPRDDNPNAAFAVLDTEKNSVSLKRVSYDVDAAQEAVRDAGLPERTAKRLARGE